MLFGFSVYGGSASEDSGVMVKVQSTTNDQIALAEHLSGKFSTSSLAQELVLLSVTDHHH